jgi:hypothetical protein
MQAPGRDRRRAHRWCGAPRLEEKTRTSAAKPDPQVSFKAAQAKAAKVGVENLTKEDIEGLAPAPITELRGY